MVECRKQTKMKFISIKKRFIEVFINKMNVRFMKRLKLVNSRTFLMIHFQVRI